MSKVFNKKDVYDEASAIIHKAQTKEKSIKSLVYESNSKNIRQLYALICESLKYASILDKIMENTAFLQKVPWMDRNLALVLLYDFLLGKKLKGACSGKYRKAVVKQKKELKAELQRMKEEKGVVTSRDLLPAGVKDEVAIPRYVRVNLLKTSMNEAIDWFLEAGYTCVMTMEEAMAERQCQKPQDISNLSVDIAGTLGQYEFAVDLHLDDVLVFTAGTDFHSHPLYLKGNIILMDKASCFPAHVLGANPGSHVIDACAAPGNKTSHLASLLGNKGKIQSYDLDAKRIEVMNTLLARAGVTSAETIHQDFLTSDPHSPDNEQVEYIIVDPSCSGSGMAGRKDFLVDESMEGDPVRLSSLQQLQRRLLRHALSFPAVKRVVYSTCSVHREENEDVVRAVLKGSEGFRLVPVMGDTWDHRGLSGCQNGEVDIGAMCLRASPRDNLTNGFFVALFERTKHLDFSEVCKTNTEPDIGTNTGPKANNGSGTSEGSQSSMFSAVPSRSVDKDRTERIDEDSKPKKKKKKKKSRDGNENCEVNDDANETTAELPPECVKDGSKSTVVEKKKKNKGTKPE